MDSKLDTVQAVYAAFGRGDVPAILRVATDDVDWASEPESTIAPWHGIRRGTSELPGFFQALDAALEVTEFTPLAFATSDTDVMAVIRFGVTARRPARAARWICTTGGASATTRSAGTGAQRTPRSPPSSSSPDEPVRRNPAPADRTESRCRAGDLGHARFGGCADQAHRPGSRVAGWTSRRITCPMTATQRLIAAGPGRYPNPLDTSRLAGSGARSSIPRERRSTRKLLATSANLVTWIWYPAAAPHGSEPAAYLPAGWQPVDQLLGVDSAAAACHAIGDAPLSGERAAYPVLFLSPSGFPRSCWRQTPRNLPAI